MDLADTFLQDFEEDEDKEEVQAQGNEQILDIVKLDNEIIAVAKQLRDMYGTKFKELEQIVLHPVHYARVVQAIGNATELPDLTALLPAHTILTMNVAYSTSAGKPLPPDELQRAMEACATIINLNARKQVILSTVQSRMQLMAPNMCNLVGAAISAQLIGLTGGLRELSETPSCNMHILGANKAALEGFGRGAVKNRVGLLGSSDIILNTPTRLRQKALRLLANKVALAARVDLFHQDKVGAIGQKYRDFITKKIEKWQEPPPAKKKKALKRPQMKAKKRRGGRKFKHKREMAKMTELEKQRNRVGFGKAELIDDYTGESFGMLGQSGTGKLRVAAKTRQKKLSKKSQARLRRVATASRGGGVSGIASSIVFTETQGIELVNPMLAKQNSA